MSDEMVEAMADEFDTVAAWTADAAAELGPDHALPAACRGSGGPGALRWLLDRLGPPAAGLRLLDIGAGLGGPAEFARRHGGLDPVLVEPERGAARGARRLFGLIVVRGSADRLPVAAGSVDAAWSIAVLCTIGDQRAALAELRRVVRASGRAGLLVYLRATAGLDDPPEGNHFLDDGELQELFARTGWRVDAVTDLDAVRADDGGWERAAGEVETLVGERHGSTEVWQAAHRQEQAIGRLLSDGSLVGRLFVLR